MKIEYNNHKMIFPQFDCDCGYPHNIPDLDVYVGSGILKDCAGYLRNRNMGTKALLVADNITYPIAGRYVEKLLTDEGMRITLCLLEREDELKPDETAIGEILLSMNKDTEFLISVGSGSVTDATRYVAFNTGRPFVCIGTAPSMDGYTSVVAPLLFHDIKINKPASYPVVIICDLDIMKSAPPAMFISGIGDVLGKYIAKADWILGNIVNHEAYCPMCADFVIQAVQKCMNNIDEIRNRTEKGTRVLIEALILAGVTTMIIGNTRAVASVEHNMSHCWEMMKLAAKEKPPSHGTAVGVGTVYSLMFYEQFMKLDLQKVNKSEVEKNRLSYQQREDFMVRCYGEKTGKSIMQENPEDFIDWTEQERRINAMTDKWELIREELNFLPTSTEMVNVLKKLCAPITAAELGINDQMLDITLKCAKDYRSRYSVCKALDELGILKDSIWRLKSMQLELNK